MLKCRIAVLQWRPLELHPPFCLTYRSSDLSLLVDSHRRALGEYGHPLSLCERFACFPSKSSRMNVTYISRV